MSEHTVAGMSRRDLIKKGAIVGGLVWAAPVVTKITPAYGQTSAACTCASGTLYRWQFTAGSGNTITGSCGTSTSECEPTCWDVAACAPAGSQPTAVKSGNDYIVTLPAGATAFSDASSCVRSNNSGSLCGSGTPGTADGRQTLTYSGCQSGEVINVVFCA